MTRAQLSLLLLALPVLLLTGSLLAKQPELPEVTEDGLHRVHDAKMAVVYAKPGAHLAPYDRVLLLDAHVAFRKNWERDYRTTGIGGNRLTSKDIERIKQKLAAEFRAVFTEELNKSGYAVTGEAADDVLLIRPAIVNLDVEAPDIMASGRSHTFVESAGEMTLYLELYDSVTGDLIAKAIDARADNRRATSYTWANSATNKQAADRILKGWAEILVAALNEAHTLKESTGTME